MLWCNTEYCLQIIEVCLVGYITCHLSFRFEYQLHMQASGSGHWVSLQFRTLVVQSALERACGCDLNKYLYFSTVWNPLSVMLQVLTRMTIPLCLILCRLYLLLSYCCCISEFAHNCIVYPFLVRSEFVFINPNSKGQCGCGESFMTTNSTGAAK